jgi:hypothetical protein
MRRPPKTKVWRLLRVLFLRIGSVSAGPGQTGRYAAVTPRRFSAWFVKEIERRRPVLLSSLLGDHAHPPLPAALGPPSYFSILIVRVVVAPHFLQV